MARHRLTLIRSTTGPGWLPKCVCGWVGLPRQRAVAKTEYGDHRKHLEYRAHNYVTPRELTPVEELPVELLPPMALLEHAVDEAVARILG